MLKFDDTHTQENLGEISTFIFCFRQGVKKWVNEWIKKKNIAKHRKSGVDEKRDCGNSGYTVSHHSSTVLRQHKAARHAAAGSSSKASSMMTAWKCYLGLHSQPSNTALWGTQQTGLAFQAQAAALRDDWITMQSSRTNTMAFTEVAV